MLNNIYNPKDCWHRSLFIFNDDMTFYENKNCALLDRMSQKNRESWLAEYRERINKSMRDEMDKEKRMSLPRDFKK